MTEPQIVSKETVQKAIEEIQKAKTLLDSFDVDETEAEGLDAKIDALLESPEIDAMLENVAADAADDAKAALALPSNLFAQNNGGTDRLEELRKEFKAFEARVAAAFKHAGFKF